MADVNKKLQNLFIAGVCMLAFLASVRGQEPEIVKVTLSKEKVFVRCPYDLRGKPFCSESEARVVIEIEVKGPRPRPEEFNIVASGGHIEREGDLIMWNLWEAPPGKHSLTVGLGSGDVIRGKTMTKTVILEECPVCDRPCSCFSFELKPPANRVAPGDAFIVEAIVGGVGSGQVTYKWSVSDGTIVEGHRTSRILIRTLPKTKSRNITVRVEVGGNDPACNCPSFATQEVPIAQPAP